MSDTPVTYLDWELHKAVRDQDLGQLLLLYHRLGECNLKESGIVQHFVNWVHSLKIRGYGAASEREDCAT